MANEDAEARDFSCREVAQDVDVGVRRMPFFETSLVDELAF